MRYCQRCQKPVDPRIQLFTEPLCERCQRSVVEQSGWAAVDALGQELPLPQEALTHQLEDVWTALAAFTPHACHPVGILGAQVQRPEDMWRDILSCQQEYRTLADNVGSAEEFQWLLRRAKLARSVYGQYMRRVFWYDPIGCRWIHGGRILHASSYKVLLRETILQRFHFYDALILRGLVAVLYARARGLSLYNTVAFAAHGMRGVLNDFPLFTSTGIDSPYETIATRETIWLSGWAATQIRNFPRMLQALDTLSANGEYLSETKWRELPSAVVRGWYDFQTMSDTDMQAATTKALQNAIAIQLIQDASPTRSRSTRQLLPPEAPSVEEMWLREEAHRAMDRVLSALPPRESAIWDLASHNIPYAEIATRCGVAEGTVKATVYRVRQKLRNAVSA